MSRKTLITIAIIVILALLSAVLYFTLKKQPSGTIGGSFPGGGLPTDYTPNERDGEETNTPFPPVGGLTDLNRLYELHKAPVAGAGFIEDLATRGVSARYIQRGLGHIYETPLTTLKESRISNETHTRIGEAIWGNAGKSVVIRHADEDGVSVIKTRILNIGGLVTSFAAESSTSTLNNFVSVEEIFLPDFIPFMATAEDGSDKMFYLENSVSSAVGSVGTFQNGGITSIFSSIFTEWIPQFPNKNLVTLSSRPSAGIPGHFFFLDTKTKALTKILGGINGLTTKTSRDGKSVLYAETKNNTINLYVYDVAKKSTKSLSLKTLPEKCAWSAKETMTAYCAVPQTLPPATYPDQWYQGLVSFSDTVWKINTETGEVEEVFNTPALDVINPVLSSDDSYLLFMNKITGTPWVYRLVDEVAPPPIGAPISLPVSSATPSEATRTIPQATNMTEGMVKIR